MLGFLTTAIMSAFYRLREEAGQNLVETALIIGVISVVLIGVVTATDVQAEVSEIAKGAVCTLSGGDWAPGAAGVAGSDNGVCTP